ELAADRAVEDSATIVFEVPASTAIRDFAFEEIGVLPFGTVGEVLRMEVVGVVLTGGGQVVRLTDRDEIVVAADEGRGLEPHVVRELKCDVGDRGPFRNAHRTVAGESASGRVQKGDVRAARDQPDARPAQEQWNVRRVVEL